MSSRYAVPAIAMGLFCAGLSGVIIAEMTHMGRAIAGGVIVGLCAGAFVWFAPDMRRAFLRMILGMGGTILGVPWAAVSAYFSDRIYGAFARDGISPPGPGVFDDRFASGIALAWIGTALGLILLIWAMVAHIQASRAAEH